MLAGTAIMCCSLAASSSRVLLASALLGVVVPSPHRWAGFPKRSSFRLVAPFFFSAPVGSVSLFFGNPAHRGGDGTTSPSKALASSTLLELAASEQHIVAVLADTQHD